jgi:alpha-tubulin suppressor-like RCC1 family protein
VSARQLIIVLLMIDFLFGISGCAMDPQPEVRDRVTTLAAGASKTCVILDDRKIRCWGRNDHGRLGSALPEDIYGDDEPASAVPTLDVGGPVVGLALDIDTSCFMLRSGDVRCWGGGSLGALGIVWEGWLGDDETMLDGRPIDFGGVSPLQIATGSSHACARFDDGTIKCWGYGGEGATGYGSTENLGDTPDEQPKDLPTVDVGGPVRGLFAAAQNTCVVLADGRPKCWGHAGFGRLGPGITSAVGDDETPASIEPLRLAGGPVATLAAQGRHICALHDDGAVSCWGEAGPWLGYGKAIDDIGEALGDDEDPASMGHVPVGGVVVELAVGNAFTCARLEAGSVKCWGASDVGQLGYGNTNFVGYHQTPAEVEPLELGGAAIRLVSGWDHTCALLADDSLRCWGVDVRVGYGSGQHVGDDETPAEAGPVPFR